MKFRLGPSRTVLVGASLILHVIVLLLTTHLITHRRATQPPPQLLELVELPKNQLATPAKSVEHNQTTAGHRIATKARAKLSNEDLSPFHDALSSGHGTGERVKSIVVGGDDPQSPWGEGGGEFERIQDFGLMDHIYQRTDAGLFYPAVLANHRIQGWVKARLLITERGRCDWHRTQISSADQHLRVFVLSILKNVCEEDFRRYINGRKISNIDLSFQFEITEHNDEQIIQSKKMIVGNVLAFYRNSQHSIAQWRLGPFTGMFPIPQVAVDFGWLKEHWDTAHGKQDPIKEYEDP